MTGEPTDDKLSKHVDERVAVRLGDPEQSG